LQARQTSRDGTTQEETMKKIWAFGVTAAVMSLVLAGGVAAQAPNPSTAKDQQPGTVKITGCLQQSGSMPSASGSVGTTGAAAPSTTGTPGTSTAAGFVLLNARSGIGGAGDAAPAATTGTATTPGGTTAGASATAPASGAGSLTGKPTPAPQPGVTDGADKAGGAMYYLDGQNSQLRDHVGHQVEITGFVASGSGPMTKDSSAAPAGASATGQPVPSGQPAATPPAGNTNGLLAGGATTPTPGTPATNPAATTAAGPAPPQSAGDRLAVQSVRMIAPNCSSR
jgi:hypothetical protein